MKKRTTILLLMIFIISIIISFNIKKDNKYNNTIAMYINNGSGYSLEHLNKIPNGYVIDENETNSHCTNAIFTWNDETNTGSINTVGETKCKLYLMRKYIKVTFDANGGNVSPNEDNLLHNSAYQNLPTPTKSGYSFEGWYLNGTKITSETTIDSANDVTLVANYIDDVAPTLSLSKGTYKEGVDPCTKLTNSSIINNILTIGGDGNPGEATCYFDVYYEPFELTFEIYESNPAPNYTPSGSLHVNHYYLDENANSSHETSTGYNYSSNGSIVMVETNKWVEMDIKPAYGYYKYGYRIIANGTASAPPIVIRNMKLWGQLKNSFYIINVSANDPSGVSVKKYAKGSQNKSYFTNNGYNISNDQIRVTENGTYTVYVKDAIGNDTVQTIQITNIV